MPTYKHRTVFEIARGIKAFFRLEAGVTRVVVPEPRSANRVEAPVRRQLAAKDRQIAGLRAKLARNGSGGTDGLINPENLIWIFCTSRSGSTWMAHMMEDMKDHTVWHEPAVGELFGNFYYERKPNREGNHYILGGRKNTWLMPLRSFVLEAASLKFPEVVDKGFLAAKEPASAIGAPLIMQALPESRMIFLVRDPRDVAASSLDAQKEGSWFREQRKRKGAADQHPEPPTGERLNAHVERNARKYRTNVEKARQAYEAHGGPKALVKYEDLRADTLGEMKRIYSTLGIPFDQRELAGVVEKHSWENIPEDQKGEGKFYRKGSPGSWREDLSPEQIRIVETMTAPLIEQLYPYTKTASTIRASSGDGGSPPGMGAGE